METTYKKTILDAVMLHVPKNVFEDGSPMCHGDADATQEKCSLCVFIDTCLERQAERHARNKASRDVRGSDAFGFLNGSVKSFFAHHIAKHPCTMKDIKTSAKWNTRHNTFYDAFNELRRRDVPIAAKDGYGRMMILKSRLSDVEKQMIDITIDAYGDILD